MKFEPLTQAYIDSQRELLQEGEYRFVTKVMEDYYVKATGEPNLKVVLDFQNPKNHSSVTITDYLPFKGRMVFKTDHYLKSVKRTDAALAGEVNCNEFRGLSGIAKVYIGEDANGNRQNKIRDYIFDPYDSEVQVVYKKMTDLSVKTEDFDEAFKALEEDIPFN